MGETGTRIIGRVSERVVKQCHANSHTTGTGEVAVCKSFKPASEMGRRHFKIIADPCFIFKSTLIYLFFFKYFFCSLPPVKTKGEERKLLSVEVALAASM